MHSFRDWKLSVQNQHPVSGGHSRRDIAQRSHLTILVGVGNRSREISKWNVTAAAAVLRFLYSRWDGF